MYKNITSPINKYFDNLIQKRLDDGEKLNSKNLRKFFLGENSKNVITLLSSAFGEIDYPLMARGGGLISKDYDPFLQNVASVIGEKRTVISFSKPLEIGRVSNVKFITERFNLDTFIQDYILVMEPKDKSTIFLINNLKNDLCSKVGNNIKRELERDDNEKVITIESFFYGIDGGNLIIGKDFVFIGESAVNEQLEIWLGNKKIVSLFKEFFESESITTENVKFLLKEILAPKKRWIIFSNKGYEDIYLNYFGKGLYPPSDFRFHLDMFLTYLGRNNKGKRIFFIGVPESIGNKSNDKDEEIVKTINEKWYPDFTKKLIEIFPEEEIILERIPIPFFDIKGKGMTLTYNNCIIENYSLIRRAILPSYYCSKYDIEIKEIETEVALKFSKYLPDTVFTNDILNILDKTNGSLHCSIKILKRKIMNGIIFYFDNGNYYFEKGIVEGHATNQRKKIENDSDYYIRQVGKDLLKIEESISDFTNYEVAYSRNYDVSFSGGENPKGGFDDLNVKGITNPFFFIGSDDDRFSRGFIERTHWYISKIGIFHSFVHLKVSTANKRIEVNYYRKI